MNRPTLRDRLRYHFDGFISRGTTALLIALIAITGCVILGAAALLLLAHLRQTGSAEDLTFAEAVWLATTRVLDPGVVANDVGWAYRLLGFVVTLSGVLLSSALVGILVSGLYRRLEELRRGRTLVVETGHTLILGWSPLVFTLLHELARAPRNAGSKRGAGLARGKGRRNCCIVLLTERDRVEVEEEIRLRGGEVRGTRIVCRSGNPLDPDILPMVSPQTARAIVVLASGGESPDLPVAQALRALDRDQKARELIYHVVAALRNPSNLERVRLVSDPGFQVLASDRVLACLTAHACRQPDLLRVYEALLRFEGTPIQFVDLPVSAGDRYGDAVCRVEQGTAIGLRLLDGTPHLNPPLDTPLNRGDRLIVIAPAGATVGEWRRSCFDVNHAAIRDEAPDPAPPGKLLVLGWNRRAPILLRCLGRHDVRGSNVTVLAALPPQQMQASCAAVDFGDLEVIFAQGDPYDRPTLEAVIANGFSHVVILSPTDPLESEHADVFTTVTLLYLRDIARETFRAFTVIREVSTSGSRDLLSSLDQSEAFVRDDVVGLVLAQVAENWDLGPVLVRLLSMEDVRIALRPARHYIQTQEPVSFGTVMAAAQARQETAIGYQLLGEPDTALTPCGLRLAPSWAELVTFSEKDFLVLLVGGRSRQQEQEAL